MLTLPINDEQNFPPPERVVTPDPPSPPLDEAILANIRNHIINQFRAAPNLHNVTNSEDWSLADPHTLLHLLTNPSEDQSAILELLAPKLDLATTTDIWDAWAAAFAHTDGTFLTTEFRGSAQGSPPTKTSQPIPSSSQAFPVHRNPHYLHTRSLFQACSPLQKNA